MIMPRPRCHICGHEMHTSGLYLNCGGDCMLCMARAGDDSCIADVIELAKKYHLQLELVRTNLFRGLSHSLQRLQAKTIDETLKESGTK